MSTSGLVSHKSLKIVCFFIIIFVLSCSNPNTRKLESPVPSAALLGTDTSRHDLLRMNSLALLPIEFDEGVRHEVFRGGKYYDLLSQVAERELQLELIHGDKVLAQYSGEVLKDVKKSRVAVGKKLGTDGVVVIRLHEYVERLGSKIGANRPAQVDFTIRVISVTDGEDVWSATYHVKEEPLSDNLFSIKPRVKEGKSGATWDSAQDILERGFRDAFRDFEQKRTREFLVPATQ